MDGKVGSAGLRRGVKSALWPILTCHCFVFALARLSKGKSVVYDDAAGQEKKTTPGKISELHAVGNAF